MAYPMARLDKGKREITANLARATSIPGGRQRFVIDAGGPTDQGTAFGQH